MFLKCILSCLFLLFIMAIKAKDEKIEVRETPRDIDFHRKGDKESIEIVGDKFVKKFVNTLINSEKYIRMIETLKRKLDHTEKTFNEKWNIILHHLVEFIRFYKKSHVKVEEPSKDSSLKSRASGERNKTRKFEENMEFSGEDALEARLSLMENLIEKTMGGVKFIVTTMTDIKNSPNDKTLTMKSGLDIPMDSTNLINEFRRIIREPRLKKCECRSSVRTGRLEKHPTDCYEIQKLGFNVSGIYKIKPDDMEPFYVLCDLTTLGGGWTVFQNRYDGSQDFFKGWSEYKDGFGNLAGEFWLGLEKLAFLTNQKLYELRVEIGTHHGHKAYASYSVFTIGPEYEGYRISTLGMYAGTAGDSLSYHAGQKFSTKDADNDEWKDGSCSIEHGGAWWYKECDKSNLNGQFAWQITEENRDKSIYWISFKGPSHTLMKTKMMLRPLLPTNPSFLTKKTG